MRKGILLSFVSLLAIIVLSAACGQTASNDRSTMSHNSMNHNGVNHNSASVNSNEHPHHAPMTSDPDAASAPFDLQFIDTMIHHHEGALEMSGLVLKKSSNEELKKFAQEIIDDQKKEISRMKEWREKWFAGKPAAKNMEMPGMADSMTMMSGDMMKKLEGASGREFDFLFLEMMSAHHEGALVMANEAQLKAERAEIKTLAGQITKAQQEEIKKMSDWRANWLK